MSLAAYASATLHDQGPTPRAVEAPRIALEGLEGVTLANASRYAREAATRSLEALLAGDTALAMLHLRRAQRWDAYAATLTLHA